MKYLEKFEYFNEEKDNRPIKDIIKNARIPNNLKEEANKYLTSGTYVNKSRIFGLTLHEDLKKIIRENQLPSGFSMGIDKDGYFIHTHRARCKSCENVYDISKKDIKFIDSTG